MFKYNDANFFRTEDNEQIYYLKNFQKIDPKKPVMVFNYGLVCSNHHWKFQIDHFDRLGHQILIHDYRGHFQSTGAQDIQKITFPQIAKDINDLCEFLGIDSALMIGHSMGVNICLQLAKDQPKRVKAMVLISGTFMPVKEVMFDTNIMEFLTPMALAAFEKYPTFMKKFWSTGGANPLIKQIVHKTGFNFKKVSMEFIEIYLNRVGQLGIEMFFQLFREMTRQNIIGSLDNIHIPTLVIGGHKDGVIPNHMQRTLASILPQSEEYYLKDGSHVPQADFPDLINERIELFMKQHLA